MENLESYIYWCILGYVFNEGALDSNLQLLPHVICNISYVGNIDSNLKDYFKLFLVLVLEI
jgi:hypothetical protein